MKPVRLLVLAAVLLPSVSTRPEVLSDLLKLIRNGETAAARMQMDNLPPGLLSPDKTLFLKALLTENADSAAVLYRDFLDGHPDSPFCDDALLRLAQLDYALGLYQTAARKFREGMKRYSRSPLVQQYLYGLGISYMAGGEKDSATACFDRLKQQYGSSESGGLASGDMNLDWSGGKPAEPAHSAASKPSPPPASAPLRYAVQVGAFSIQSNALLNKAFFEGEGFPVQLSTKKKNGTVLYLVWVGFYDTEEKARGVSETLKKKYDVKPTLVQE